jgi:RNA polymerase sigma-70 factor (ECF subfamily)
VAGRWTTSPGATAPAPVGGSPTGGVLTLPRTTPDERIDVRGGPVESQRSATVEPEVATATTGRRGLDLPDVAGDPVPTWEEIATRYGPKVYTMAYRLTGDPEEAKDLSQDVFVRVYRNLDKYEPGTFEGWLYRITKNLFLDRVRRRKRVRMEPLPDEEWKQPEEEEPGPAERLEAGVLRGDIEEAITELPPDFRTAVVMCDVQGLTYEEIAAATGWPLGTVRSRIHRGRKLLRKALTPGPGTTRA